jgi:hypothetical protein
MNPFQQQVLQGLQQQYGFQNQNVLNSAADQAQGQNAFGGKRSDILAGTALSQNQMGQNQQYAGVQQQGFEQAMQRAMQLAGLGQNANAAIGNFGQMDAAHLSQALAQTFAAYPHATQGSGTQTPAQPSTGSKIAGTLLQGLPFAPTSWGLGGG